MAENRTPVCRMALYSDLRRVREVLSRPEWTLAEAEAFSNMHYLGVEALDHAAKKLGLAAGDAVLDLGSGFGGAGRYLHEKCGCEVVGVELQEAVAGIAETVNVRYNAQCGVRAVATVVGDFLEVGLHREFDHALSLLAVLHVALAQRDRLFQKLNGVLKPGGSVYIEDFFQSGDLTAKEKLDLDRIVSCPGLPTQREYVLALERAGFSVEFEDVTGLWTDFVAARAQAYGKTEAPSPGLLIFYETMRSLFEGKNLGGARITASKRAETEAEERHL